ncbi:PIN domain-containing protein [candidate division KSB1 bacterium]
MEKSPNKPKARRIILDTNFLLIPANFNVDIFSELDKTVNFKYELIILDRSLEELENIILKPKKGVKGADKVAAKVALSLIEVQKSNKKLNILPSKGHVDDALVRLAEEDKTLIVATQDKDLKKRLKEKGVKVIVLKQKKYLAIEG